MSFISANPFFTSNMKQIIQAIFLSLVLQCCCNTPQPKELLLIPKSQTFSDSYLDINKSFKIIASESVKPSIITKLRTFINVSEQNQADCQIRLIVNCDKEYKQKQYNINKISGAYNIKITEKEIVIVGYDDRGLFYALNTLQQLAQGDKIHCQEITDNPDIEFRGVVEGFYGPPWTFSDRIDQLKLYGQTNLNTYIYGPKDDPYHSSPHWRQPYPENEAKKIEKLAEVARENRVDFIWAIHPGKDIKWNKADRDCLLNKFEMMYQLGVRGFAVFFDDIEGVGTDPVKQSELMNFLNRVFLKKHKDVQPLIICPTQYNKGWADDKPGCYLDILGKTLDPEISVMWTGDKVVGDITTESLNWVNKYLRRKAYIWWNFPVNDYATDHLLLGESYGLTDQGDSLTSGFVANPMEKAESSKLAIISVAQYCWNVEKYNPSQAWQKAIEKVTPNVTKPFEHFANYNCDPGPNWHKYRRSESQYWDNITANNDEQAIINELNKIIDQNQIILDSCKNKRLLKEIKPWVKQAQNMANLGIQSYAIKNAFDKQKINDAWKLYCTALNYKDSIENINTVSNQGRGVKVGTVSFTPYILNHFQDQEQRLLSHLMDKPYIRIQGITSFDNHENFDAMFDNNLSTSYCSKATIKPGDYVGVDLGESILINNISIYQDDRDRIYEGVLEYSQDSIEWQKINNIEDGQVVRYSGTAFKARFLRYTAKIQGSKDGSIAKNWYSLNEFVVNDNSPMAYIHTSNALLKRSLTSLSDQQFKINKRFEIAKLAQGDCFGVKFTSPVAMESAEIDLQLDDNDIKNCKIEVLHVDGSIEKMQASSLIKNGQFVFDLNKSILGLWLKNNSDREASIKIEKFIIDLASITDKENDIKKLYDNDFNNYIELSPNDSVSVRIPESLFEGKNEIKLFCSGLDISGDYMIDTESSIKTRRFDDNVVVILIPEGTKILKIKNTGKNHLRLHEIK